MNHELDVILKNLTLDKAFDLYHEVFIEGGDERSKGWFLLGSPIAPTIITLLYYVFVTQIGPKMMKNRKPFAIKKIILVYNAFQVFANLAILFMIGTMPLYENYFCMQIWTDDQERNMRMPNYGWIYYMMKYIDMLDTIFFVLTKKQHLISTLHLFHHTSMIFATWVGVKYYPSGVLAVAPYLNTIVHAIMYGYYFSVAYFGKIDIVWKKMMTTIQLIQFGVGNSLFIIHLLNPYCDVPKLMLIPIVMHGFIFIYMFGQFYYKNYVVSSDKTTEKKTN